MRKILHPWAAGLGTAISLALSSCTYDPYYSSAGGYYGYGDGYGYGGSNFSTSFFITTGDPRWGYDPYTYCYYDYRSRRYYDPYLYGYYPVGYRPYAVYGAPHPYGWRRGHGHCPPPRTVRNVTVVNYRDRESAYRNSNYSWARQVKKRPSEDSYRHDDARKPDYRRDYRSRDNEHDSSNTRSWPPQETIRSRESYPDSRASRERHRHDDHRSSGRSTSREFLTESTRDQSSQRQRSSREFDRTQFKSPGQDRSRRHDAPGVKPPESGEKNEKPSKSERKGLRSLGDA